MLLSTHAHAAVRRLARPSARGGLGALLLALVATSAMAQTYYVDPSIATCSATATGTAADPYCTIAQAMTAHRGAGVTIIVKPGIYREVVTVPSAGASGAPFVLQASGPGVVIDGADDFRGNALWALASGSTYRAATVTWAPVQVFVNGARLTAAAETDVDVPVNGFRWVAGEGLYVNLGGANPGSQQTFVGRRRYGFNVFTKSFIKIIGFEVTRADDRGILMQNGCTDIEIIGNKVTFSASYGIQTINGQRMVLRGNVASDNGNHGIGLTAGAADCMVADNESFRNVHPTQRVANGIYLYGAPNNTLIGNRVHDNQDTGMQFSGGSNNCIAVHNRSWKNGDHGYDHLGSSGVRHVNDIAYANYLDGYSFEGNSPGGSLYNSIGVDNGVTNGTGRNLWVDAASAVGFSSDHNVFWNSTLDPIVKWIDVSYSNLAQYQAASGQDGHSRQGNPLFVNAANGDFRVNAGSSTIDMAHSGVANWPALDITGAPRLDELRIANTGQGSITYADAGVFEYVPVDMAPVVTAPPNVKGLPLLPIVFTVTASDPDDDPILSFTLDKSQLPAGNNATFEVNAAKTSGTFRWTPGLKTGNYRVTFLASNTLTGTASTRVQILKKIEDYNTEELLGAPGVLAFSNGFPNPSMGEVDFALDMPEAGDLDWQVFDAQGRVIYSQSQSLPAGRHRVRWEGTTMSRQRAGTGIYFVRAKVAGTEFVRRVVRF
jgi:parallel beta-helix repeat protein